MTSVLTMPPAATATGVVTTTPDGAEDGHTSRTNPGPSSCTAPGSRVVPHRRANRPRALVLRQPGCGANTKQGDPLPRAPKLCGHTDCLTLVHPPLRYCPEHTNRWKHSPRTVGAKRCSTTEWKQQRIKCLQRDERKCQIRGPRCTVIATEVDHVTAVAFGGTDDLENLQAACHNCHATKSGREGRSAQ